MKRHKFFSRKKIKSVLKGELNSSILISKYLENYYKEFSKSFSFSMKFYNSKNTPFSSQIYNCCIITGRIRYPITITNTSRHIFFEFCRNGHITGFFFAS